MGDTFRTLATTAWALVGAQAIRLTAYTDGSTIRFATLRGFQPTFDPFSVAWLTDAAVGNLAAHAGIALRGDTASAARLIAAEKQYGWRTFMTIEDLAEHKHLGKGLDLDVLRTSYAS